MRKRNSVPVLRLPGLFSDVPGGQPPRRTSWSRVLAIDPGFGGTGWALWDPTTTGIAPTIVGVYREKAKNDTLAARSYEIASALGHYWCNMDDYEDPIMSSTALIIEMPQHMASAAGIAAQSGAIYKLTFLVGYLAAWFHACDVHVVTPGQWKGQLPKQVVQERITRILGKKKCDELEIKTHAWDAVGIGLWAMGMM